MNILQIVIESEAGKQKTLTIKNVRSAELIDKAKITEIFEALKLTVVLNGMKITKLVSAKVTQVESTNLDLL